MNELQSMTENDTIIECKRKSRFGDYKIFWKSNLSSAEAVFSFIESNLPDWVSNDSPSIWVKLSGKDLDFLNKFLSYGFIMHRIKPGNVLVLNKWIRKSSMTLPPAPFSYVGIGVLCVNHEGKILAVRENYKSGPGPWKFPGGLFDTRKDKKLSDGAMRECFEETGVKTRFDQVVAARLNVCSRMFHSMDIYYVCKLIPENEDIHFDPIEIADCQWVDYSVLMEGATQLTKLVLPKAIKAEHGFHEKEVLPSPNAQPFTVYEIDS